MKISGIYKIESRIKPNKIYIGSSVNIHNRWLSHLASLRKNRHKNPKLQNHYNKYGESDLLFSVIIGCDKEDLIKIEQYFLDFYKPWFNVHIIADRPNVGKRSKEVCQKISQGKKGKPPWNKGKKMGRFSEERLRKHSERHKGQTPWIKGRHHTEESKRKSSESHKGQNTWTLGRKDSEETRKKKSEAMKGRNWWKIGRKQTAETIQKRKDTRKRNKLLKDASN